MDVKAVTICPLCHTRALVPTFVLEWQKFGAPDRMKLGTLMCKALGRFTYNKLLDEDGRAVICEVAVFPLAVRRQLKVWPEIEQREIRWVAVSEAAALTDEDGLRPLLEAFSAKMEAKRKPASERGVGIAGAIPTRRIIARPSSPSAARRSAHPAP